MALVARNASLVRMAPDGRTCEVRLKAGRWMTPTLYLTNDEVGSTLAVRSKSPATL